MHKRVSRCENFKWFESCTMLIQIKYTKEFLRCVIQMCNSNYASSSREFPRYGNSNMIRVMHQGDSNQVYHRVFKVCEHDV